MGKSFASIILEELEQSVNIVNADPTSAHVQFLCDYLVQNLPELERNYYGATNWDTVKTIELAMCSDQCVGFMCLCQDENYSHLGNWIAVAIDKDFRGQGICKKLFENLIIAMDEPLKDSPLLWYCNKNNTPSIKTAEKLGFKQDTDIDDKMRFSKRLKISEAVSRSNFHNQPKQLRKDTPIYTGYAQLYIDKVKDYEGKVVAFMRIGRLPTAYSGLRVITNNISQKFFGDNLKETLLFAKKNNRAIEVGAITLRNRDGYDYAVATIPASGDNYIKVI